MKFLKKVVYTNNIIRYSQLLRYRKLLTTTENRTIADIGCGDGYLISALKGRFSHYYAIEPTEVHDRIPKQDNVTVKNESFEQLSLTNESIDVILLSSVIQMVDDDEFLLKQCHRVLKRNGSLIISAPVGYILIKPFYGYVRSFFQFFNKAIPSDYQEFLEFINDNYGNSRGFYQPDQLKNMLSDHGFKIEQEFYSPGYLISLVHDLFALIRLFGNKQIRTSRALLIFIPLAILENMISPKKGNEIIISARKI